MSVISESVCVMVERVGWCCGRGGRLRSVDVCVCVLVVWGGCIVTMTITMKFHNLLQLVKCPNNCDLYFLVAFFIIVLSCGSVMIYNRTL